MTSTFTRLSAIVLGAGSIGFGAWAVVAPRAFASFMGSDPDWARLTGVRDLVIGAALCSGRDVQHALAARATADAWDAATVRERSVAAGAAAFSVWALTAAAAGPD